MSGRDSESLDTILRDWLAKYGEPANYSSGVAYMRLDIKEYPMALNALVQTLVAKGYTESELYSSHLKSKLHRMLTPEGHRDKKKLQKWKDTIDHQVNYYCDIEFARPNNTSAPKEYAKPVAQPKPEVKAPQDESDLKTSKEDLKDIKGLPDASYVIDEDEDLLAGLDDGDGK